MTDAERDHLEAIDAARRFWKRAALGAGALCLALLLVGVWAAGLHKELALVRAELAAERARAAGYEAAKRRTMADAEPRAHAEQMWPETEESTQSLQASQVQRVQRRGGKVVRDSGGNVGRVDCSDSAVTDDDVLFILFLRPRELSLRNTKVGDDSLRYLQRAKGLRSLDLRGTSVTDAGVKQLQEVLPQLQVLR